MAARPRTAGKTDSGLRGRRQQRIPGTQPPPLHGRAAPHPLLSLRSAFRNPVRGRLVHPAQSRKHRRERGDGGDGSGPVPGYRVRRRRVGLLSPALHRRHRPIPDDLSDRGRDAGRGTRLRPERARDGRGRPRVAGFLSHRRLGRCRGRGVLRRLGHVGRQGRRDRPRHPGYDPRFRQRNILRRARIGSRTCTGSSRSLSR
mmetsp:Transcript_3976/g.7605  ORF Transcript_3976/g.7605 Transcript_3976/m.7605 type:complete len:201 (+) Transcript_3976:697-1299(+)